MRWLITLIALGLASSVVAGFRPPARSVTAGANPVEATIARGKYLVAYGGCNDCHTPGWRESDGKTPVKRWLTGSALGYRSAWGTSYPENLRRRFREISEAQWSFMIQTRGGHPPMVWTDLRVLNDADRKAIYRFVMSLGPAGAPSPFDVRSDRQPKTPYVDIEPTTGAPR